MSEKALTDVGNDASESDRNAVTTAITALKDAMNSEDAEDISAKTNALEQVAMKLGEIAYRKAQEKAASEGNASGDSPAGDAKDGDVIDADFTEGDDKK